MALAREASRRADTELVIEQGTVITPSRLEAIAPDAVIIPPLAHPLNMAPADVTAHADAVDRCLEACLSQDVALVWCVSDQLYEDGLEVPIDEHVVPAPRDDSLRRLVQTGNRIRADVQRHLIVRLGPLFALEGSHAWLNDIIGSLVLGKPVRAAEDVIFCPTSADAVAMALIGMLQQQGSGSTAAVRGGSAAAVWCGHRVGGGDRDEDEDELLLLLLLLLHARDGVLDHVMLCAFWLQSIGTELGHHRALGAASK